MAARCKKGMTTQSIRFTDSQWTVAQARAWLRKHGKKSGKVDHAGTQLRFRQFEPSSCGAGSFRVIRFGRGIQAVVCCPRRGR